MDCMTAYSPLVSGMKFLPRKNTPWLEMDSENFEPKWTKNIPNWAMCNWFYAFFLANVIVAALIIFSLAYVLVAKSALKHVTPYTIFLAMLHLFVAGTNALFFYLICDRTLQPEK